MLLQHMLPLVQLAYKRFLLFSMIVAEDLVEDGPQLPQKLDAFVELGENLRLFVLQSGRVHSCGE